MGNWRTVDMKGSIDKSDVKDIRNYLSGENYISGDEKVDCLRMSLSLCGIGNWVNDDGSIDVSANLFERDYDNDDIEIALDTLVKRYPSLSLVLHSGSDYESTVCSASFHVHNGAVTRCLPEVEEIRPCRCLSLDEYFRLEREWNREHSQIGGDTR